MGTVPHDRQIGLIPVNSLEAGATVSAVEVPWWLEDQSGTSLVPIPLPSPPVPVLARQAQTAGTGLDHPATPWTPHP